MRKLNNLKSEEQDHKIRLAVQWENKISVYGSCENIPNSVFKYFLLEGPEPLYYVCLSVTPAVSGVRGANEHQKLSSVPLTLY